jgi:hypothetical protein
MIKPIYLNIRVPESVRLICAASGNTTVSSNAAKLIGQKLSQLPNRYLVRKVSNLDGIRFNLPLAINAVVYAKLAELAIIADLSIGETCAGLICDTFEWDNLEPKPCVPCEIIALEIGCLRRKQIGNHSYWYWRYYTMSGKKTDIYLHKQLDRALAMAKSRGIPDDANPKHRRRH